MKNEIKIENYEGKKVIIRGDRSGVFFGTFAKKESSEVTLVDCRRLWYWDGANSISQLAVDGTKKENECKFTVKVKQITILDCVEIILCEEKAIESIEGVYEWKI